VSDNNILVFDALNAFFRAYIIDPSLTPNGNPVGGVRTFMRIMQKEARNHRADEILICWDGPGGSKRKRNMDNKYKEGRAPIRLNRNISDMLDDQEKKENMAWQQIRLTKYLNDMPVKQMMYDNIEADDIISYITQIDEYGDDEITIVSNDKDFIQLLFRDNVTLHRPTSDETLKCDDALEEYNIHPNNFTIARALVGDSSDNLDGVKGIGMKTAVRSFPFLSGSQDITLEDVFEHSKEEKGRYKSYDKVLNEQNKVRKNYKMMQLYSPLLSPDVKGKVRDTCCGESPKYKRIDIAKRMRKDGFGEEDWSDLFGFCRRKQIEKK